MTHADNVMRNVAMIAQTQPHFEGGTHIAMKVPRHLFDHTVTWYRDVLRLPVLAHHETRVVFGFGTNRLWVDRVAHRSHAEVWLELATDNVAEAASHLAQHGTIRRDDIEALPEDVEGFWIRNPANIMHLVRQQET